MRQQKQQQSTSAQKGRDVHNKLHPNNNNSSIGVHPGANNNSPGEKSSRLDYCFEYEAVGIRVVLTPTDCGAYSGRCAIMNKNSSMDADCLLSRGGSCSLPFPHLSPVTVQTPPRRFASYRGSDTLNALIDTPASRYRRMFKGFTRLLHSPGEHLKSLLDSQRALTTRSAHALFRAPSTPFLVSKSVKPR